MRNNLIKKALSIALALSILANLSSHIHAADLVAIPQNVRTPILTPAPTQTRSTELSFKSFEAKISNVFKREKTKPRLAATYSGACGTGVTYNLDTTADVLTISGSGAMTDYTYGGTPWHSHRSFIKTVVIENGVTSIGS